jgi:hypothetical protein
LLIYRCFWLKTQKNKNALEDVQCVTERLQLTETKLAALQVRLVNVLKVSIHHIKLFEPVIVADLIALSAYIYLYIKQDKTVFSQAEIGGENPEVNCTSTLELQVV